MPREPKASGPGVPTKGQERRWPAGVPGLLFIARFRPIGWTSAPIFGASGRPLEIRMRANVSKHPSQIALVIGRVAKFGPVLEHARESIERRGPDDPATMMAQFGPRIGKEDEQATNRRRRQTSDYISRVALQNSDIGQSLIGDVAQRARDAIEKRLDADEADIGIGPGLPSQVFAAAKADLEPKIAQGPIEQTCRIDWTIARRQRDARIPVIVKSLALGAKLVAAAATVKLMGWSPDLAQACLRPSPT